MVSTWFSSHRSSLFVFDFSDVELELLSFQNVSVGTSALTGSAGETGQNSSLGELLLNLGVDDSLLLQIFMSALDVS